MKKLFLIILFFGFIAPASLSAISFEVYSGTAYPAVLNATATLGPASDEVTITANVTDISGVAFAKASIDSVATNLSMMHPDSNNNTWIVIYKNPSGWAAGTYAVDIETADWLGNNSKNYGRYDNAANFTVASQAVTSINDFLIDRSSQNIINVGEHIQFSAFLKNAAGPLSNRTIIFSDQTQNRELCRDNTDPAGYAFCPFYYYTVPLDTTVGEHMLKADFLGDAENVPASAEKSVTVPLKPTEITPFNASLPYPYSVGSLISFSGNLNYDAEDAVIDAMPLLPPKNILFVDVTANDNIIRPIGANGTASGSFISKWPAGLHTMQAIYSAGDGEHAPSVAERTFTVNGPTEINPFKSYNSSSGAEQTCIRRGGGRSLKLKATLKFLDPAKTPVSGTFVNFSDFTSGVDLGTGTTDSAGVAEFTYVMPNNATIGCHRLKASAPMNSLTYSLSSYNDALYVRVVDASVTCAGKPPCP